MSVTNEVPPTLDEMIFAISQINYNTVCRLLSPPPPSTDRLSASVDNITEPSPTKMLTNADTNASVIDDDTDVDEDNSENEEDNMKKIRLCPKNRPFTDSENKSVADRYTNLMAAIVNKCQKKIKSRISKVLRRVRELSTDRGIHFEDCLFLELVEKLKAKLGIGLEQSLRNSLISWLDYLSPAQRLKDLEIPTVPLPPPNRIVIEKTRVEIVKQWARN
ncbi:hypothetical protein BGX38DRAFT_1259408 [Terfezia claveryi]|nr:hypothetical protein BGX38DRAFT_1259408 [Terfezia claveryi]